jgi:hypothetical protein
MAREDPDNLAFQDIFEGCERIGLFCLLPDTPHDFFRGGRADIGQDQALGQVCENILARPAAFQEVPDFLLEDLPGSGQFFS